MDKTTLTEDLIGAVNGIGNHRQLLTLCVADYLTARHIAENAEYAKEITFVCENRDKYPEMWLDYAARYPIADNAEYASIYGLVAADKKRQADFTEKYLRDYYVLRDKYAVSSFNETVFPEMSRGECPIHPADYIELNKEYAYLKSGGLPCSAGYFDLMIFGEKENVAAALSDEIKTAASFISDPDTDQNFLNLNIEMLSKKIASL